MKHYEIYTSLKKKENGVDIMFVWNLPFTTGNRNKIRKQDWITMLNSFVSTILLHSLSRELQSLIVNIEIKNYWCHIIKVCQQIFSCYFIYFVNQETWTQNWQSLSKIHPSQICEQMMVQIGSDDRSFLIRHTYVPTSQEFFGEGGGAVLNG